MKARISRSVSLAVTLAAALAAGCGGGADAADPNVASDDATSLARGGRGSRPARTCAPVVSCSGSPFSFSGIVDSVAVPGGGLTVATGDSTQTVYGLGPVWYWSAHDVNRPVVGDAVEIVASHVTTSEYPVILSISVNGAALDLRDAATCVPLW